MKRLRSPKKDGQFLHGVRCAACKNEIRLGYECLCGNGTDVMTKDLRLHRMQRFLWNFYVCDAPKCKMWLWA